MSYTISVWDIIPTAIAHLWHQIFLLFYFSTATLRPRAILSLSFRVLLLNFIYISPLHCSQRYSMLILDNAPTLTPSVTTIVFKMKSNSLNMTSKNIHEIGRLFSCSSPNILKNFLPFHKVCSYFGQEQTFLSFSKFQLTSSTFLSLFWILKRMESLTFMYNYKFPQEYFG